MVTEELLDYIRKQLHKHHSKDAIANSLVSHGWDKKVVEEAFDKVESELETVPAEVFGGKFLGPVELFRLTWVEYRKKLWTLLGVNLMPSVAMFLAIFFGVIISTASVVIASFSKVKPTEPLFFIIFGLVLLLILVILIIQVWGMAAIIEAIRGENIGVGLAYKRSWPKLWAFWWVGVVYCFLILGGTLLFLVPGVLFALWFPLCFYVVIDEKIGGLAALQKSKFYISGRIWGVIGRVIFIIIAYYCFLWIVRGTLSYFKDYFLPGLLTITIPWIINPFISIYCYKIYQNLKALKSGHEFISTIRSKVVYVLIALFGFTVFAASIYGVIVTLGPTKEFAQFKDLLREEEMQYRRQALAYYFKDYGEYPATLASLKPDYLKDIEAFDSFINLKLEYVQEENGQFYTICVSFETKDKLCLGPGSDIKTN